MNTKKETIPATGDTRPENSAEIMEVIGTMPSWTIRWGIIILCGVFVLLFFCSTLIHFPDTLQLPASISRTGNAMLIVKPVSNAGELQKIKAGQKMLVYVSHSSNDPFVGAISSIQQPADTASAMQITLQVSGNRPSLPTAFKDLQGNIEITLRERSVFDKMFGSLFSKH